MHIETGDNRNNEVDGSAPKILFIVFPDNRITGGYSLATLPQEIGALYFEEKFRAITIKLINRYKRNGYKVFGLLYSDSTPETFSMYYPVEDFDSLVKATASVDGWTPKKYKKELPGIIESFNLDPDSNVVIGGYHAEDCVAKAAAAFIKKGFKTSIDLKLTNHLTFLLVSHRARAMLPGWSRNETAQDDYLHWQVLKKRVAEHVEKE